MTLTERDCMEIYYALESKIEAIKQGKYGTPDKRWIRELEAISSEIGPDGSDLFQLIARKEEL